MRVCYAALTAAVALCCPSLASAQEAVAVSPTSSTAAVPVGQPIVVATRSQAPMHSLANGTEVFVTLNQEITSKRFDEGDMFGLTVSHDVMLGQYVVIPKGTPAMGEVTWRTGRAVFGNRGKWISSCDMSI